MRTWRIICSLLLLVAFGTAVAAAAPAAPEKKVAAYLAHWQDWTAKDIAAKKLTHINLSFARIENGQIANSVVDGKSITDRHFAELAKAKLVNPNLKVCVAVGGWGGDGFSDAALTPASRELFADSVASYLQQHDLDGIDIDWEFPVNGAWGTIKSRPEDKQNFTLFLQAIRERLDRLGQVEGKHYLLTYASNISPWAIDNIEFSKVVPLVDAIYLMTYDLHGGWEPATGHHTPLYANPNDKLGLGGAADAVKRFIAAGAPAEKLVLGTAFYGRYWQGVEKKDNGLYQKASTQGAGDVFYRNIVKNYTEKQGFKRYWDDSAKAAYLFNAEKGIFVTYDDPEAIRLKVDFARQAGIGGVFTWELTQDDNGQLLDIMYQGMKK